MISHGKDIKIFTGNANPALAQEICKLIGIKLGEAEVKSFADGEASVSLYESVRGSDVFLINSTCKPVNDSLMELLIMIDACKRASAGRVTAVIPYFGYARQDRKAKSRDPISAKLVANMITASGADRVLTMDLHASQIQGFFDIPVDNLLGNPVFVDYYAKKFGEKCENMAVVSPDVGSVARARTFAQKLHMSLAIVDKRRQKANQCEVMNVIGDVAGKDCILFDDMIDTAGSICNAAKAIVEVGGANHVYACASHAVLSGPAIERINNSVITEVAFLDTIPAMPERALGGDLLIIEGRTRVCDITARLLDRGYRRLGFVGDVNYAQTNMDRYRGFLDAHAAHGVTPDPALSMTGSLGLRSHYEEISRFLASLPALPDAFICPSDFIAHYIQRYLSETDVPAGKCPILTGFDNNAEYANVAEQITTVDVDTSSLGKRLARQLIYRADYPQAPYETTYFSTQILYRGALAQP